MELVASLAGKVSGSPNQKLASIPTAAATTLDRTLVASVLKFLQERQIELPNATAIYLGCSLVVLQVLDGILTSIGVSRFGTAVEGNPFLRQVMENLGHVSALALLKSLAIVVVILLTFGTTKVNWLKQALAALTCIYLFTAVLPWTYILFIREHIV